MFFPDQELVSFRKSVAKWVNENLTPNALAWDEEGIFPKNVFTQAGKLGFLGIRHDPKWGGLGLDFNYTAAFIEELTKSNNCGVSMALMVQCEIATPIINELGTDEQKNLFLKPSITGEKIAALGISEPNCGSDVANIETTAKSVGDDYVINGSKMWITNGTRADFITLAVRTRVQSLEGVSLVTFPTNVKGFEVGKKLKKIGNLSSDTAILYFDNCKIPKRFILGEENLGFQHIMTNFQGERLVAALCAVAISENIIKDTIEYGIQRKAFGKPLIKFQALKHKVAEHMATVKAAKCLTYHAIDLFNKYRANKGNMPVSEVSMAKLMATDMAQKVAYDCQQIFGGMGYVTENPVARAWCDLRLLTVGAGASEVMKEIISKCNGF